MNWTQPDDVFLAVFVKKTGFFLLGTDVCGLHRMDGNEAAADSTAALSFASMDKMLQSMAAVKTTAKRDVLFMT